MNEKIRTGMGPEMSRLRHLNRPAGTQGQAPEVAAETPSTPADVADIAAPQEVPEAQESQKPASISSTLRLEGSAIAAAGGLANLTVALVAEQEVDKLTGTWKPGSEGKVVAQPEVVNASVTQAKEGESTRFFGVAVNTVGLPDSYKEGVTYETPEGATRDTTSLAEAGQKAAELAGEEVEVHLHMQMTEEMMSNAGGATLALIPKDELSADGVWTPKEGSQALAPELYTSHLHEPTEAGQAIAHIPITTPRDQINEVPDEVVHAKADRWVGKENRKMAVNAAFSETLSEHVLTRNGYTPETAEEALGNYVQTAVEAQSNGNHLPVDWVAEPENRKAVAMYQVVNAGVAVAQARKDMGHGVVESAKVVIANGRELNDVDRESITDQQFAQLKPNLDILLGNSDPFKANQATRAIGDRTTMAGIGGFCNLVSPPQLGFLRATGQHQPAEGLQILEAAHMRANLATQAFMSIPEENRGEAPPHFRIGTAPQNLTLGDLKKQSDVILEELEGQRNAGLPGRLLNWGKQSARALALRMAGVKVPVVLATDKMVEQERKVNATLGEFIGAADQGDAHFAQFMKDQLRVDGIAKPDPYGHLG